MSLTPLDKALAAAQNSREKAPDFYNLFLATPLYFATWDTPSKEEHRVARAGESIRPAIVEQDGYKFLMLFDTKERLGAWAKREIGFMQLKGQVILEMMSKDFRFVLNAGSTYWHEFAIDEIAWLMNSHVNTKTNSAEVNRNSAASLSEATDLPLGVLQALKAIIKRNTEIKEAFLGKISGVNPGESPHIALVLRSSDQTKSKRDSIAIELSSTWREKLGSTRCMDVLFDDGSGIASEISASLPPFFAKV